MAPPARYPRAVRASIVAQEEPGVLVKNEVHPASRLRCSAAASSASKDLRPLERLLEVTDGNAVAGGEHHPGGTGQRGRGLRGHVEAGIEIRKVWDVACRAVAGESGGPDVWRHRGLAERAGEGHARPGRA